MKKTFILFSVAAAFGVAVFSTSSCKKSSSSKMTLYDSLGGTKIVTDPSTSGATIESGRLAIRSVIDSTIFVIAGDTAINGHFTTLLAEVTAGNLTGFENLSKNLTDFVAVATGAKDYTYGGLSMADAHNPAKNPRMNGKADDGDFTAFENDLVAGANKNAVPSYLTARLGAIVETLRSTVVQQ